ncbi:MAG: type II secretion system protein GspI, partial [Brevundimonas sp.]
MRPPFADKDAGFTLVEVIVALSILAIATVSLIRASEAHVDLIGGVRERVIAQWVAENRLAELEITHGAANGPDVVDMMGVPWRVDV